MNSPSQPKHCSLPDCDSEVNAARGFCNKHYLWFQNNFVNSRHKETKQSKADLWRVVQEEAPNLHLQRLGKDRESDQADPAAVEENQFVKQLKQELRSRGHGVWTLHASVMAGAPDLLIISKAGKVLLREVKTDDGRLMAHQGELLVRLAQEGYAVGIWRPKNWHNGKIIKEVEG